ncbi:MAG: TasA family protein [Candidatus Moraniibacteriota bacterium]
MMKIVKSLSMIAAVVAIAGGGTYALWSDTATIYGSTFSAGTMNLKIDKNPLPNDYTWSDSFNINDVVGLPEDMFKNLYPGYPTNPGEAEDQERNWQVIDIMDVDGTVPNSVATIKFEKTSGSVELANNLRLRVYFDAENDGFVDESVLYDAPLSSYTGVYTLGKIESDVATDLGGLDGKPASIRIEWYVPASAGNDIQGDSLTVNTIIGLQQVE